jgi:hypothetical protein
MASSRDSSSIEPSSPRRGSLIHKDDDDDDDGVLPTTQ